MNTAKHRGLCLALALLLALGLAGCQGNETAPLGDTIAIELEANPSTGYMWKSWCEGPGELVLQSNEYAQAYEEAMSAGTPVAQRFVFQAAAPGKATLELEYEQSWTGGQEAYMVTYSFEIKEDLTVAFLAKEAKALGDTPPETLPDFPDPVIARPA